MAERTAVNRLTKVRFLPGAQQDASSKLLGLTDPKVGRRFTGDMWVRVPPNQMHLVYAAVVQLVERYPSKVAVAGPSPVCRSIVERRSQQICIPQ